MGDTDELLAGMQSIPWFARQWERMEEAKHHCEVPLVGLKGGHMAWGDVPHCEAPAV